MWKELKDKEIAVKDFETDGFLEDLTTVHCGTIIDALTGSIYEQNEEGTQSLLKILDSFDVLVGHNIIGYDLPMLKKMYNWEPTKHVIILDTLWMSRMYSPDLDGGHSLGAWGRRLGDVKTEYYPVSDPAQPVYNKNELNPSKNPCWTGSIYTEAMGNYCTQDVKVNVKLFWKLVELLRNFSWRSIICEMDTAAIIQRQITHGFVFDYERAESLHAKFLERIAELEDEVHNTFHPLPKLTKEFQPKIKMDGVVSSVGLKKLEDWENLVPQPEHTRTQETESYCIQVDEGDPEAFQDEGKWWVSRERKVNKVEYHSGAISFIEWPEFSLGSRQQIAERLIRAGYKLTKFTEKKNAIIDDAVLQEAADAGIEEAKPLAEYFLITKREGMVKDWLARAKWHEDQGVYRIHGYVNTLGAITNRMGHSSPNVAQVPASYSPYGKECRALFTVRAGYKLVGCDASGLELRCLASYMKDVEYARTILTGDIHSKNQEAAGLPTRDMAKVFIYSFLYGGGDLKVGQIVGGNGKTGKALKEKFLEATPALKKLREAVINAAGDRGWLKGIDGRILRVRKAYAALNTLLQGMGAIVMKYWLIEVSRRAEEEKLNWNPSANIHDEGQFEVLEKDVSRFCEICEEAFPKISKDLNLFCELAGEAKVGVTWNETH